tara:strand:- start:34310 stop:34618 length:309 start_codon:yes stop_codon:yes gene_type:complete
MAKKREYKLKSKVFLWSGDMAAWHFAGIDKKVSAEIKENFGKKAKGFHSVPVEVTVGKTVWGTSIFPDSKSDCYVLPLKAKVRKAEDIWADKTISYKLKIRI